MGFFRRLEGYMGPFAHSLYMEASQSGLFSAWDLEMVSGTGTYRVTGKTKQVDIEQCSLLQCGTPV